MTDTATITSPLKAVRAKCLDCCCYQPQEVRLCVSQSCPLHPFRMGRNPHHKRVMTDEQKEAARERLKKGGNRHDG